jgi:triacylglycerol lipase
LNEMKPLAIDISWDGLTRPGQATDHFAMDRLPPFSPNTGEFSLADAFWLSEISRHIYHRNDGEGNVSRSGPSRDEILKGVGLREALFLSWQETQCALIHTIPHQRPRLPCWSSGVPPAYATGF